MRITKYVEITALVKLEIETDGIQYGIHGGEEDPVEIAHKAIEWYADNAEIVNPMMPENGIRQVSQQIQDYTIINKENL